MTDSPLDESTYPELGYWESDLERVPPLKARALWHAEAARRISDLNNPELELAAESMDAETALAVIAALDAKAQIHATLACAYAQLAIKEVEPE